MYGDEGTWQKHPDQYSQHKIVDRCSSSMSQTSYRRKKPSRWTNINTQTHTHTHTQREREREREAAAHRRSVAVLKNQKQPLPDVLQNRCS